MKLTKDNVSMDRLKANGIFKDFTDHKNDCLNFISFLEQELPYFQFQLIPENSTDKFFGHDLNLPDSLKQVIMKKLSNSCNRAINSPLAYNTAVYAQSISELNAVLFYRCSNQDSTSKTPGNSTEIVRLCTELFFSRKTIDTQQQFISIQKKQLNRKIQVLEKQYQEILTDNQQEYEKIIKNIADGYYEIDLNGNILFFNDALLTITGQSKEELLGMNYRKFIPQQHLERIRNIFYNTYKTGKSQENIECKIIVKDESTKYIELSIAIMRDTDNYHRGFRGIARDITDRRVAEEALKESEEKFRKIGTSAHDAFITIDNQGCISYWNEAAEKIFGYTEHESLGQDLHKLLTPEKYHEKCRNKFENFRNTGEGEFVDKTLELIALKKDGSTIPIELSLSKITLKGKWTALGIARDLSERKRAEEALKKANTDIEAANKELQNVNHQLEEAIARANNLAMQANIATMAKSKFLANMSHEIRTPMNAIIGFTDLLIDSILDDRQLHYAKTIRKSGSSLLSLISDILDFSKIEAEQLDFETIEFDPEILIYDACELIRPSIINKPIEIICSVDLNVPSIVRGDPGRYSQVLTNLIANASKFTDSGEIEIILSVEKETKNHIELHTAIRDTGIGISKDKLQIIFEAFQQADGSTTRKYGGTGLGLSISKKIANLMRGNVWAESEGEGKGSIFHFTASFKKTMHNETSLQNKTSFSGKRALVVDDNQTSLRLLKHTLESVNMYTTVLSKSEEILPTLERATTAGSPYDLCIIDAHIPDIEEQIRTSIKDIPAIGLTSMFEKNTNTIKESLFVGLLNKPVSRKKLFGMMKTTLQKTKHREHQFMLPKSYIQEEPLKSSNMKILLAEDNPINQNLAKIMLSKAGFQVILANNGLEALNLYTATPEEFDLIFMDIQMPEMDGIEATTMIRKWEKEHTASLSHNIPIVAITAHAMQGDREKCLQTGMNDYISKPIKKEIVLDTIEKWIK